MIIPALSEREDKLAAAGDFRASAGRLADAFGPARVIAQVPLSGCGTLTVAEAAQGNLRPVIPGIEPDSSGSAGGFGFRWDVPSAEAIAVIEAAERYAALAAGCRGDLIWASATELGAAALDLSILPRCSAAELADPSCPITTPVNDQPIRWTRGVSLMTGAEVLVPAILAYLRLDPRPVPAERFFLPDSSGCAAHTSLTAALTHAIFELVERDAVSLTWLQKLELPLAADSHVPDRERQVIELLRRTGTETTVFDATTDLGVPTAYILQRTPYGRPASFVGAASGPDLESAISHALLETLGTRGPHLPEVDLPDSPRDFRRPHEGAQFMGRRENAVAFEFLRDDAPPRLAATPLNHTSDTVMFRTLLSHLRRAGMEAFAVDLTTDELLDAGFVAVRVVVPRLQPVSFWPRAQYRAHPRLYQAPAAMGHTVHSEPDQNHWPQPFG
jgi:ribosomal protein S12 methylthiotransferase accessory factor